MDFLRKVPWKADLLLHPGMKIAACRRGIFTESAVEFLSKEVSGNYEKV
ncbi:hypothetical protein EP10_001886 [Geobacillus icigianus]|uniref:Uncharacterized protein n=1 Tax=Geobacillus icigianus TaxID=1430331 RepID=A0ABU6BGM5_9BACL|nr:hypothetical protein B4113_1791 [Geobacillus sp. B4113_201601]MEB3751045.1 hypothetical protein [Geobacillus icigianus]